MVFLLDLECSSASEAVHAEAARLGFDARKVDVIYSETNNLLEPWGFLHLVSWLDSQRAADCRRC